MLFVSIVIVKRLTINEAGRITAEPKMSENVIFQLMIAENQSKFDFFQGSECGADIKQSTHKVTLGTAIAMRI